MCEQVTAIIITIIITAIITATSTARFLTVGKIRPSVMILPTMFYWLLLLLAAPLLAFGRPNVLVIITDDQGYGDLGFHGNPQIHTPNLDRLARESVRCKYFYVSPVCAPTRASLMTGRYNYRTGVVDTYLGRAMMFADELTLAEMFSGAGYRTGIFGKWHLGDNYPMRAMDQGFQESLVHKGGGIAQPSDPPGGDSYFDATLYRNGTAMKSKGYCTDVFSDAAIDFIKRNRSRPFFAWLAYNAPHAPLQVPDSDLMPYRDMKDTNTARVYAMVSNIDRNIGRVLKQLPKDTVVVFLTDNGPQSFGFGHYRPNGYMVGWKGSVYEGGIRVPFFIRWPGKLQAGLEVQQIAAHIDLAPTLLEACGIPKPRNVSFDGLSLWPLLTGARVQWPERTLYFQWHRGDTPQLHRAFAARSARFKLVQELGREEQWDGEKHFQLFEIDHLPVFDIHRPSEGRDLSTAEPEVFKLMLASYERWFDDMKSARGFALPRIMIGTKNENPVTLTRQDWRGPRASWGTNGLGHWDLEIARTDSYQITVQFPELLQKAAIEFRCQAQNRRQELAAGAKQARFSDLPLQRGTARLQAWLQVGGTNRGVHYVFVGRRLGKAPD